MKRVGLLIGFLAVLVFVLPLWTAQGDKKAKGTTKTAKKTDENKDDAKDPEKKDEEKKKPEPKKAPPKLVFGSKFVTKIISISPDSNANITVETKEVDPKKVYEVQTWSAQQMQQLQRQQYDISMQKDFKQRIIQTQNYQRALYTYQVDLAKRNTNIYSTKPWDVKAAENVKIRTLNPPVEFDDTGFQKKWTKKELDERRDKTGLPGFAMELDALKSGQYVEIYMAKTIAPKGPLKKKAPDDDVPPMMDRPEFVMIVILSEPK